MNRMTKAYLQIACLVLAPFFLVAAVSSQEPPDASMGKITGLVKASGRAYTKHDNGTLIVDTPKGKLLVVAKGGFLLVTFAQVLPKAYLPVTDTVLLNLLRLNDTLNYSKVGIDQEGDLFVRVETRADLIDQPGFNATVDRLVADYDKVKNAVFPPATAPPK